MNKNIIIIILLILLILLSLNGSKKESAPYTVDIDCIDDEGYIIACEDTNLKISDKYPFIPILTTYQM